MEVSSKHQLIVFLLCLASGVGCGIIFDVQRIIRKVFSAGKIRTVVEDLLFGAVCTAVTIAIGYLYNRGEIRYYQVFGAVLGIVFYGAFLSRVTRNLMINASSFIGRFIFLPIIRVLKLIFAPLVKFFALAGNIFVRKKRKISRCFSALCEKRKKFKKRMKML